MSMLERLEQLSPRKLAFLVLDVQGRLDTVERARTEPIAIVGMGCRFPGGADTPSRYWELLRDGRSAVTEIPNGRWDVDAYYDADPEQPGKMYVRRGGFLTDVDRFDAAFFGMSPREADSLDPQHRLILETAWEALEDAGQSPRALGGSKSGVFVGISASDYAQILASAGESYADAYMMTGNALNFAAGRLSYVLGLQGPCMAVDTACSSSLTAVHLACRSLRSGESDMALAGGVNLMLRPEGTILASRARMLAASGMCRTFDAAADGIVRAEGCGIVVLKLLSAATAARDRILAVIRGSAMNQDGPSSGITVPNGRAQQALIRDALRDASVEPRDVSYVEAHGTGTRLGDPIEVRALTAVLGEHRTSAQPLLLGSVKTNIGHAEAAAGIAGLMKVVLALQHREIPQHLHLERLNPDIDLPSTIGVATTRVPWTAAKRLAGVSSFGASGTNVHVVVGEHAPEPPAAGFPDRSRHVLTLSARTSGALVELIDRYITHISGNDVRLPDVCFTANAGRAHWPHRFAAVASSSAELRELLSQHAIADDPRIEKGEAANVPPRVAFLFTGQGSQHVGMGRELYETQPTFRRTVDRCDEILRSELDLPLLSALYPAAGDETLLNETAYTQPALFAIEYALAELWRSWGVTPAAVLGHSVGEYVAACVAGVFTLEDGLKLVAARGRLMQRLTSPGAMAAVRADERTVRRALAKDDVSIAAINGPADTVISGSRLSIESAIAHLSSLGIRSQGLAVSHAFHSSLMEPMLDAFERVASEIQFRAPVLPLVPNLTGTLADGVQIASPAYWREQIRRPVQFELSMRALDTLGIDVFLEAGPASTLLALGSRCVERSTATWSPSLRRGEGDCAQMLQTAARLYTKGVAIDWAGFDRDYPRRKVCLPTYPFQRARHWVKASELADTAAAPALADKTRPVLRAPHVRDWFYAADWHRVPFVRPISTLSEAVEDWLVFLDDRGFALEAVRRLENLGHRVSTVRRGERFSHPRVDQFVIDPLQRADYDRMFRALSADSRVPATVLHCWGVGGDAIDPRQPIGFGSNDEEGFRSILCLTQALGSDTDLIAQTRLGVVTSGLYEVTGGERLSPHKGLMLGPCRVVAQEHPNVTCTNIDLAPDELDAWKSAAVGVLDSLLEDASGRTGDPVVAYRHGRRWKQDYAHLPLNDPGNASGRLRSGGVYMLTGGLGEIGLHLAEYLATSVQAKLVLTTRTAPVPENQWDSYLSSRGSDDLAARRVERIRRIQAAGGDVLIVQADASDRDLMRHAFERAEQRFGRVDGLIHAAGLLARDGCRSLLETDEALWRAHFTPKVRGLCVIDELVRGRDLDFCILVSSLSTVLGGLGHTSYAAANAFMDVVACRRSRTSGFPWLTLNFDSWTHDDHDEPSKTSADSLQGYAMSSREGIDAFRYILAADAGTQVVVSTGDLSSRIDRWVNPSAGRGPDPGVSGPQRKKGLTRDALLQLDTDARAASVTAWLSGRAAQALGVAPSEFDVNQPMTQLGLDSLMAVELRNAIQRHTGVTVPIVTILDGSSAQGLVAAVLDSLGSGSTGDAGSGPAANAGQDSAQLLQQLPEMSDEDVDGLLAKLLASGTSAG